MLDELYDGGLYIGIQQDGTSVVLIVIELYYPLPFLLQ